MKRILKWTVPVDDQPHEIGGGDIIHIDCQKGPDEIQIWTEEPYFPGDVEFKNNPGHTLRKRTVQIKATGQSFHDSGVAIGSVMYPLNGEFLVWHVVSYL